MSKLRVLPQVEPDYENHYTSGRIAGHDVRWSSRVANHKPRGGDGQRLGEAAPPIMPGVDAQPQTNSGPVKLPMPKAPSTSAVDQHRAAMNRIGMAVHGGHMPVTYRKPFLWQK